MSHSEKEYGVELLRLFPDAIITDPEFLYEELVTLETRLRRLAVAQCNTGRLLYEKEFSWCILRVKRILQSPRTGSVNIHTDPGGSVLRLETDSEKIGETILERDYSGEYILVHI